MQIECKKNRVKAYYDSTYVNFLTQNSKITDTTDDKKIDYFDCYYLKQSLKSWS
jgi:hypothetical protein